MNCSGYVVDASATAPLILPDEHSDSVDSLFEKAFLKSVKLTMPVLWIWECTNLLKSAVKRRRINERDAKQSLRLLSGLPVTLLPAQTDEIPFVFEIALQHDLSVYDAVYFYYAKKNGAGLVTLDKNLLKLQKAYHFILTPDQIITA